MQAATRQIGCQQAAVPAPRLRPVLPLRANSLPRATHYVKPLSGAVLSERVVVTRALIDESSTAPTTESTPATEPEVASAPSPAEAADTTPETVFYEGPGSNLELALSLILLPTLIYAPLSMASIGRRLWITFKFTNERLVIINTSPLFKRTIEVAYKNIKEIRTGPRAFGLWGDMVVFLRDGSRLELTGLEKYKEIEAYINRCIYTL